MAHGNTSYRKAGINLVAFADLREIGENLGRFASIREKAERPQDRIIIQANGGMLKLIAGDFAKTIVATVGPTDLQGRAVVSSRLLLGAIKTLKAKGEADFTFSNTGAQIRTNFGSEIDMPNVTGTFRFLRPVAPQGVRVVRFDTGYLSSAAKYLAACTGDFPPLNQVIATSKRGGFSMFACDNRLGVDILPIASAGDWEVHLPADLWPALRGLDGPGYIDYPEQEGTQVSQVVIESGRYLVGSVIWKNAAKLPVVPEHEYTATVVGSKRALIDTFKSLAGGQDYSRVVISVTDGTFEVTGKGNEAARPNVEAEGSGALPVNATFMSKVLNTVDGTTVSIKFADAPSMVRVVGDKTPWPIRLAPMK